MNDNDPFIRYLHSLRYENAGTLAALRRACGERLAQSRNCQWFSSVSKRPVDFLTATLAAQYSATQITDGRHYITYRNKGSIGAAWAQYCREHSPDQDPVGFYQHRQDALAKGQDPPRPPSIHERFRTLLDAELEFDGTGELAYRLRGLVRMCVAADVPLDVIQLACDLRGWCAESRYVQERWAEAFYGQPRETDSQTQDAEQSESDDAENETSEEENETYAD